ncbi:MAG TPA: acetyltransferase [Saprospiraceae bacterium]|nr:acetyltransferase [Saprospiraceae bacterium]
MNSQNDIALIGYSGHSFVVADIFLSTNRIVSAYADTEEKKVNPYQLRYLGNENQEETIKRLRAFGYFVSIGDNLLRRKISELLIAKIGQPENAFHTSSIQSNQVIFGKGIMLAPRVVINSGTIIGNGVILNTGCIVEHECKIGNYSHVAPGAVLCGNVSVGENVLVGAGAIVLPGVNIGHNAIIGAGTVVTKSVEDNLKITGIPGRKL